MKILMVCLGNICRSPLAQGIIEQKIKEQIQLGNLFFKNWEVDSAGTSAFHVGELPDKRSIKVATENNIDISCQRSRQFKASDFKEFDIIYAMDKSNYNNITAIAKNDEDVKKVKIIMTELNTNIEKDVPDPYYGEFGFESVYKMLDEACTAIIEKH